MNAPQRVVLCLGAAVFFSSCLFVPWKCVASIPENGQLLGWSFLWRPAACEESVATEPAKTNIWEKAADPFAGMTPSVGLLKSDPANAIDWDRLLIEWAAVIVVTGSLVAALKLKG